MNQYFNKIATCSVSAMALFLCPAVSAGGDTDTDTFTLEEIIVTAQKREESLQDAPISITAFSKKDLLEAGVDGIADYAYLTPSMSIDEGHNKSDVDIVIRGIGNLGGSQNLFGLYVDGVEMTAVSNRMLGMSLLDIERVEVLRGPQGTTFGRNVVSGAINITSTTPKYEFEGESRVEYGRFGELSTQHIVNVPLQEDVAALRLGVTYSKSDGFLENSGPAGDTNDFEIYGLRGTLLLEPNDRLTAKMTFSYDNQDFGVEGRVPDGRLVGSVVQLRTFIDLGLGLLPPGTLPAGPDTLFPEQNRFIATSTPTFQKVENFASTANVTYDFAEGDVSLVTVAGYATSDFEGQTDTDRTEFDVNRDNRDSSANFFSLETRLQSNNADRLNWVGGLYYSETDSEGSFAVTSGDDMEALTYLHPLITGLPFGISLLPNNTRLTGNDFTNSIKSWAAFGELSYAITDDLLVAGGVRYSKDKIASSISDVVDIADGPVAPLLAVVARPDVDGSSSFDKATWRLNVQYSVLEDMNIYASVSSGYRAGGLQLGNVDNPDFGPETILNYEIGMKLLSFDGRVRTNFALFKMDWRDVQIRTINRRNNLTFTDNAGKARVKGAELDMAVQLSKSWLLTGGLSYIDSQIQEFTDSTGLDRSGIDMPDTPKFSSNISIQFTQPITDEMNIFARATHLHTGRRLESLIDGDSLLQYIDGFDRVDMRAGVESGSWRFEGYIENLFDKIYATGVATAGFSGAGSLVSSPPQRYGARLVIFY